MTDTVPVNNLAWRQMTLADLKQVCQIADMVHPDFPEDEAAFQDRLEVFPTGALVLDKDGEVVGYSFSHPWLAKEIPALNSKLGQLPAQVGTYYLHDVAILPQARAFGAAGQLVGKLFQLAQDNQFDSVSLVAVNGSQPYWEKHGFLVFEAAELKEKLHTYSEDACFMIKNLRNYE